MNPQLVRNLVGLSGLACLVSGIGMLSIPWMCIIGGGLLFSLSCLGTIHAGNAARKD